ncbi:SIS domain-containing protein [Candidatus Sumerlaeota bacterium]|nr:SIS domain-containing protein [Candidatus Sumerlaeota bacterium]
MNQEQYKSQIQENLRELSRLTQDMAQSAIPENIVRAAEIIVASLKAGGKALACGNGGSAADAQHFIGELVGRYLYDRPAVCGMTLSTDIAVTSAICNDYDYFAVFERQIEGLGRPGDVLIAFSTSGSSPNILRAIEKARAIGMRTVMFAGAKSNPAIEQCDALIQAPSEHTPRIQELHTALYHAVCEIVERELFPPEQYAKQGS